MGLGVAGVLAQVFKKFASPQILRNSFMYFLRTTALYMPWPSGYEL